MAGGWVVPAGLPSYLPDCGHKFPQQALLHCCTSDPAPPVCCAWCLVQADGTVVIPKVLRPYMMGIEAIKPKHTLPAQ